MLIVQAKLDAVDDGLRALYEAAKAARERAYAPYSGFRVGAALRTTDHSVVTAANVENASYGLTICAERAAICRALAEGHRAFDAVAVAGPATTLSPCGACRQVLAEFMAPDALVVFPIDGELAAFSIDELLPHAFVMGADGDHRMGDS
jgi:cytidine deaminase